MGKYEGTQRAGIPLPAPETSGVDVPVTVLINEMVDPYAPDEGRVRPLEREYYPGGVEYFH